MHSHQVSRGEAFPLNAVFRILASQKHNATFYPPSRKATNQARSEIDSWIDFASGLDCALKEWCHPIWGFAPMKDREFHIARATVENMLCGMEEALKEGTYLVGHNVTLADLSVALRLLPAYLTVSTIPCHHEFPDFCEICTCCPEEGTHG